MNFQCVVEHVACLDFFINAAATFVISFSCYDLREYQSARPIAIVADVIRMRVRFQKADIRSSISRTLGEAKI